MTALQNLWMFFISSKNLFPFSRYSNSCIFVFPSFFSCQHCLEVNNNICIVFIWYGGFLFDMVIWFVLYLFDIYLIFIYLKWIKNENENESKKNIKFYDVINCLNMNLITHFVWYLEKEIRCDTETLSIDRELNKEHFYGKIMQKMCTKS